MEPYAPLDTPIAPKAQAQAATAYKNMGLEGTSQRELIAGVIRKVINNTYQAKDSYKSRLLEEMCDINERSFQILDVMRIEMAEYIRLDNREAADTAKAMTNIFTQTLERLANVLNHPDPEKAFEAIIDDLKPVYKAWIPPTSHVAAGQNSTVIDGEAH